MRSSTIAVPLVALLAVTLSAIVLAAQAGLSFCDNRVAVPMPDMASMPGMDMSMPGNALMICPIVLGLIGCSALLAAAAIVLLWRDPHRGLTGRTIVRALAGAPLGRTAGILMLAGAGLLVLMRVLDGSGAPSLETCAMLAGALAGASLAATGLACCIAHVVLALGRRLWLAIAKAIAAVTPRRMVSRAQVLAPVCAGGAIPLLSAGRGLRAPPPVH